MHEHGVEHEAHGSDPSERLPAFLAAVFAVLLALVSLGGHRAHTEAILMQGNATNHWAWYQASRIKYHMQDVGTELINQVTGAGGEVREVPRDFQKKMEKYEKQSKEIETKARDFDEKVHQAEKKANYFDTGEIFLEVAIVLISLSFLTKRSIFWKIASLSGAVGIVIAAMSFFAGH